MKGTYSKVLVKVGELRLTKMGSVFTYKIAIQYIIFAFKHLLQFIQCKCMNAVPLSLNYDACCAIEHTMLLCFAHAQNAFLNDDIYRQVQFYSISFCVILL
jgi:hypothetical protein